MARDFISANNESLTCDSLSGIPTNVPLTMACWFATDVNLAAAQGGLCGIYDKSQSAMWHEMGISSGALRALAPPGASESTTTNTITTGKLHHAVGIFTSTTSRRAVLDGDWANSNENTTSYTISGIDRFRIGRRGDSSPNKEWDGPISEVSVWNVALDQWEVEALAAGAPAYVIRPASLVAYYPMREPSGSGFDLINGQTLTDDNTCGARSEHGRVVHAGAPILVRTPAVAGGLSIPLVAHHYKMLTGS